MQPLNMLAESPSAPPTGTFLPAIGERVRQARAQRGMTRRALAQQSQVSERFLAQLETGHGNASLLTLQRIADALGTRLGLLVDDAPSHSAEFLLLQAQLATMSDDALRSLRLQLQPMAPPTGPRIALVGLRGAGKSTLGARLATHYQVPLLELDREIERRSGIRLEEMFLSYGQTTYRRYERRCLNEILQEYPACVIATGGSIVADLTTFSRLLGACLTVWLKANPEEHMARVVAQGDMRPMAGNTDAMDDLRSILVERSARYAQATLTVDTAGLNVEQSFAALLSALNAYRDSENLA